MKGKIKLYSSILEERPEIDQPSIQVIRIEHSLELSEAISYYGNILPLVATFSEENRMIILVYKQQARLGFS